MTTQKEKYYRLLLEGRTVPDYYGASKAFYGTMTDIRSYIHALRKHTRSRRQQKELIDAFDWYESGDHSIAHFVSGKSTPLLVQTELVAQTRLQWSALHWVYRDPKGQTHPMRCRSLCSTHFWFAEKDRFVRCVQPVFDGLEYEDMWGAWFPVQGNIKGPRYMMAANKRTCFNRLAVEEKLFSDRAQMEGDHATFPLTSDIRLDNFCDELF